MIGAPAVAPAVPGESCKLIIAVIPDDGTDLALMRALRSEKSVTRANSIPCLGLSILAEARTRRDKLPEPTLVRAVEILVRAADADAVFEFVCQRANIGRQGGGIVMQSPAPFCTHYALPDDLPEEDA